MDIGCVTTTDELAAMTAARVQASGDLAAYSDRELIELVARAVFHVDEQCHQLRQELDEHRPLIERAKAMLDAGRGWRAWRTTTATGRT